MASIIGVETLQHTNGTTAATIDSSGNVKPTASGSVVAVRFYSNNTRSNPTAGSTGVLWSVTDTKLYGSETNIIVQCVLHGYNAYSGGLPTYIEYGNSKSYSLAFQYSAGNYQKMATGLANATGKSSGSNTINIGWDSATGGTQKPFNVFNPNSSDDSRLHQMVSTLVVYEVVA